MGIMRNFICAGCGYHATVSGGYSLMMRASTQTVVCTSCKELYDVVTRSTDLGNFPPPRDTDDDVAPEAPLRCPKRKSHTVTPWEGEGPCPRCGEGMTASDYGILTD